VKESNKELK